MARSKKKPAKSAVGKLNDEWHALLVQNVKASKSERMTDEQLEKYMTKLFPEKAGKSTITRVAMMRSCFNNGTGMFVKFGAAKSQLVKFDKDGNSAGREKKETKEKKVDKKKVVTKKKVATNKVTKKKAPAKNVAAPSSKTVDAAVRKGRRLRKRVEAK